MENNTERKFKTFTINGVTAINSKATGELIGFNLIEKYKNDYGDEKENKYAMFLKKKDGTETKAHEKYKSEGYGIGSEVEIAYNEDEYEYDFKDKKTGEDKKGKGHNRVVSYFVVKPKVVKPETASVENYPF